jgi:hypothetical protein
MSYSKQEKAKFVLLLAECHGSYTDFCRHLRKKNGVRRNLPDRKSLICWTKNFKEDGNVLRRKPTREK